MSVPTNTPAGPDLLNLKNCGQTPPGEVSLWSIGLDRKPAETGNLCMCTCTHTITRTHTHVCHSVVKKSKHLRWEPGGEEVRSRQVESIYTNTSNMELVDLHFTWSLNCSYPSSFLFPRWLHSPSPSFPTRTGQCGSSLDPRRLSSRLSAIRSLKSKGEFAIGWPHAIWDILSQNPKQPHN